MNKQCYCLLFVLSLSMPGINFSSSTPATQEWVLQQLKQSRVSSSLSEADWTALCSSGTPVNKNGCYGDLSSTTFSRVNQVLGGYTTYANINTTLGTPAKGVFVKAFLDHTNVPENGQYISVTINTGMARCALFTRAGMGINAEQGLSSDLPNSGTSVTGGSQAPQVTSINNATANIIYAPSSTITPSNTTMLSTIVAPSNSPTPPEPIYLFCVGVNANDGATPVSIMGEVTAL